MAPRTPKIPKVIMVYKGPLVAKVTMVPRELRGAYKASGPLVLEKPKMF